MDSDLPPTAPPSPPSLLPDPAPTARTGLPRGWSTALLLAGCCLLVFNAITGFLRLKAQAGDQPASDDWLLVALGYVAAGIFVPAAVAGVVALLVKTNRRDCFAVAWVSFLLLASGAGVSNSTRPARTPKAVLRPVVYVSGTNLFRNDLPPFSLEIPAGFVAEAPGERKSSQTLQVFVRKGTVGLKLGTMLQLKRMTGLLSPDTALNRQRLRESLPPGVELTLKDWRGIPVDTCVSHPAASGVQFICIQMRIPLEPQAIEVVLYGPASDQDDINLLADRVLGSLDGKTNW